MYWLTHESTETVERPRDSRARVDLNQNVFLSVDVDL